MPPSDDFSTLKEQVETADQRIRASAAQGVAELKAMVDEARNSADTRAAQIGAKAQEAGDKAEAHWNQVQSDWDQHGQDNFEIAGAHLMDRHGNRPHEAGGSSWLSWA